MGVYYKIGGHTNYQLTDHLGNVRAVVTKTDPNPSIFADYYPGGMQMPNRNVTGDYRYGYQGEYAETDPETGKPAFQLRLYDPRINRWLTTDPKGQYHSPYMSMGNNWVSQVDPDGGKAGENPVYDIETMEHLGNTESGASGAAVFMKSSDFTEGMSDDLAFRGENAVGKLFNDLAGFQQYNFMKSGSRLKHELMQIDLEDNIFRFEAGKTYKMDVSSRSYVEAALGIGANLGDIRISYKGQTIRSLGISTSFGVGSDVFSRVETSKVTFHVHMSGHSLADVFNQAGLTTTRSIGGFFKYAEIKGYDNAQKNTLLWSIKAYGAGLIIGASGERATTPFYNYNR